MIEKIVEGWKKQDEIFDSQKAPQHWGLTSISHFESVLADNQICSRICEYSFEPNNFYFVYLFIDNMGCNFSTLERSANDRRFSVSASQKCKQFMNRKIDDQHLESPLERISIKNTERKVKTAPGRNSHIDLTVSTTIQLESDKSVRHDSSNGCISPPLPSDGCLPQYSSCGYMKHAYNESPSVIFSPLKGRKRHSDK